MKKGKLIFKEDKYFVRYLETYSGRDNGGFESDRTRWSEVVIDNRLQKNDLEHLLGEEIEFQIARCSTSRFLEFVAIINLSNQQERHVRINQLGL